MLNYLLKNLRGTDWELLTEFVSPAFFQVVPTWGMTQVLARIAKDYGNKQEFERIKDLVQRTLHVPIADALKTDGKHDTASLTKLTSEERRSRGQRILRIYFAQLLHCDAAILDLRAAAFPGIHSWSPQAIFYRWQPEFRRSVSKIYQGFYSGNDSEFSKALEDLDLLHAAPQFKQQFGSGHQDAVLFRLSEFKKSFHEIFQSCIDHKTKLHPDFFALGVYLLCLYEHLETLNVPLDVRQAFKEAQEIP